MLLRKDQNTKPNYVRVSVPVFSALYNKVNEINYLGKKFQVRSWLHLATSRSSIMRLSLEKKRAQGDSVPLFTESTKTE